jgi:hypothetical protein
MDPTTAQDPFAAPSGLAVNQAAGGYGTPAPPAALLDNPLAPLVKEWLAKIKLAWDYKMQEFGRDAIDCMRFFNGPYDFLYKKEYACSDPHFQVQESIDQEMPAPTFRMTLNKVAELVQIFGPVLYHKNPDRQVNPRKIPLPPGGLVSPDPTNQQVLLLEQMAANAVQLQQMKDKARAQYLQWYLNYTPDELNLKDEMRAAIDEGLIKGFGVAWVELYQPKGQQIRLVGSFYDSVDNLVIDPDAERLDQAQWVARRCVHPVWEVEREYGLQPGSLKGSFESYNAQSVTDADDDGDYNRKRGLTNDLIVYWKVYSKMGMGGRLKGANPALRDPLELFGDYCYLVIAEHCPYPLNMPPEVIAAPGGVPQLQQAVAWPTPFWADDCWPFAPLVFHPIPRRVWPMSHLKPALGELKFLNWAYSMIASKMRVACRDFLAVAKSAGEEIKDIILHGQDFTLIEIEKAHGTISQVVEFLQHPQFQGDIWTVIDRIVANFERRTGLSELIYGESSRQMRSASEAQMKQDALSVRPDDMATRVEEFATQLARMEALAVRWHLTAQDVLPLMGQVGALYWQQLVQTTDVYALTRQLEYRIEAGSAKKPNRDRDSANLQQAMSILFQPLYQYAQVTGNVGPVNALISDWATAIGMDATKYLLAPPPPPPVPVQAPQPGGTAGRNGPAGGGPGGPPVRPGPPAYGPAPAAAPAAAA